MNEEMKSYVCQTRVATGLLKPNSLTSPGFSRFFQAHFSQHFISFAVHKIAIVRYADVNSLYGTVLLNVLVTVESRKISPEYEQLLNSTTNYTYSRCLS